MRNRIYHELMSISSCIPEFRPHGRPESGQTLTLLGFMRMSARSGFAQRSKRLKQLRENEQQRQFAGALMHGVGVASW